MIEDDKDIFIAIDSTGIKVTNRGQWMSDNMEHKKERLSKDSHCCKYTDQGNTCSRYHMMRKFMRARC